MKIVCISDTHAKTLPDDQLPEADVLIHAGDITNNGKVTQLKFMADWFLSLRMKYKHIVCIAGNHDFILDGFRKENAEYALHEKIFPVCQNIHYLRDSGVTVDGISLYGTPWTICGNWAFSEMDRMKRRAYFDRILSSTEVLITHGPPYTILDKCDNGAHGFGSVGDLELLGAVERVRPRLHVFGHIHDGYGMTQIGRTTFVNAAVTRVKGEYELGNAPIVVEI